MALPFSVFFTETLQPVGFATFITGADETTVNAAEAGLTENPPPVAVLVPHDGDTSIV